MTHCLVRTIGCWSRIFAGLLLLGSVAPQMTGAPATPGPAGVRVGTFQRGSLVMAFYRSAFWSDKLGALMEQRKKAGREGDNATIEQVESQVRGMQALAEKQLAGREPIDNIYEQLRPMWAEIAREADVQLIVDDPLFLAPNTLVVDITPYLVKRFPSTPRAPKS